MGQVVAQKTSEWYKCVHFYVSKLKMEETWPEIASLPYFWVKKAYFLSLNPSGYTDSLGHVDTTNKPALQIHFPKSPFFRILVEFCIVISI